MQPNKWVSYHCTDTETGQVGVIRSRFQNSYIEGSDERFDLYVIGFGSEVRRVRDSEIGEGKRYVPFDPNPPLPHSSPRKRDRLIE